MKRHAVGWDTCMSDLEDEIGLMADEAVRVVKDRTGETLDFSEGSLAIVEATLDEASRYFADLPNEEASKLVHWFGCYLLEVGRRNFGGIYLWYEERDQPVLVVGEPEFHVAMITWDKVKGRLSGDKADNVPFFFEGFAQRAQNAEAGTRALYV
jgi:hypothetical protein